MTIYWVFGLYNPQPWFGKISLKSCENFTSNEPTFPRFWILNWKAYKAQICINVHTSFRNPYVLYRLYFQIWFIKCYKNKNKTRKDNKVQQITLLSPWKSQLKLSTCQVSSVVKAGECIKTWGVTRLELQVQSILLLKKIYSSLQSNTKIPDLSTFCYYEKTRKNRDSVQQLT